MYGNRIATLLVYVSTPLLDILRALTKSLNIELQEGKPAGCVKNSVATLCSLTLAPTEGSPIVLFSEHTGAHSHLYSTKSSMERFCFCLQLNDVESGGFTVFVQKGLHIKPRKVRTSLRFSSATKISRRTWHNHNHSLRVTAVWSHMSEAYVLKCVC